MVSTRLWYPLADKPKSYFSSFFLLTKQQALLYYSFSEGRTMSRSTISTFQLFQKFPDVETARKYLESRLWQNGVTCPKCVKSERIRHSQRVVSTAAVRANWTSRFGQGRSLSGPTFPFTNGYMPCICSSHLARASSSLQLGKEIGITQKSAWFVLHRLREACGKDLTMLQGHCRSR